MKAEIQNRLLFRAAWLYYMCNKRQSEVATILGVARTSVALYLKQARNSGMVRIGIDKECFREQQLSMELESRFGIESAYILQPDSAGESVIHELAILGAEVLLSYLADGDELGVAWGEQLYELAKCLPPKKFMDLEVVQLAGNLGAPFGYAPEQCTLEIAGKLKAKSRNLYAPLSLSDPALARKLREEPIIKDQLKTMATCTKAVFSIGSCKLNSHIVKCGAISSKDMQKFHQQGATGTIAGRLIDQTGKPLQDESSDRTIAISLARLKKIPFRLVIAGGKEKTEAILSGLRGGYVTHLVIDSPTAESLVAIDKKVAR